MGPGGKVAQKTDFSGLARPSAQSSGGRHPAARPPINLSRAALSIAPAIWGQKQFRKFSRNLSAENRVNRAVLENDGDLGPGPSGSENRNLAKPRNQTQVVPARVQHVPPKLREHCAGERHRPGSQQASSASCSAEYGAAGGKLGAGPRKADRIAAGCVLRLWPAFIFGSVYGSEMHPA